MSEGGVTGEVVTDDERDGPKGLRQEVGHGEIEGHDYRITQNVASATVAIEFADVTVEYEISDIVEDAYEQAFRASEEGE